MKGAWKKVTGSVLASDGINKGDRRGSTSKESSTAPASGGGEGPGGGALGLNSNNNALLSKLRQTVVAAQLCHLASGSANVEKKKVSIWHEWNDNDVNAEKWDFSGAPKGKDDKKGKSPTVQSAYFDDPDGKLDLPSSLRVDHWKRPHDFMGDDKLPVVVDVDHMMDNFDLMTNNAHLLNSEFIRFFISQVTILWELCTDNNPQNPNAETSGFEEHIGPLHNWRPWEHIFSLNKVVKNHIPLYNPYGKYLVRIYWMGCWRRIPVDDLLPFDEHDQLLLPVTMLTYELWPMLLAKALIKVASLDYSGGSACQEFGDMQILHNLTGWLPEAIPLHTPPSYSASQVLDVYYSLLRKHNVPMYEKVDKRHSHLKETWELLKALLPEWTLPQTAENQTQEESTDEINGPILNIETPSKDVMESTVLLSPTAGSQIKASRPTSSRDKVKDVNDKSRESLRDKHKDKGGKESKEDKKDKKDKDKDKDKKDKGVIVEEPPVIPDKPEVVIFAMFGGVSKPYKVSQLARMADASERLRQNGLSHQYPHPVFVTQTRSCSMEPPPAPEVVPAWKLIRPRKKKERPTDEPKAEEEPPKEIQCLEIKSPFVNYNANPMPIPTSTLRTISCLERGLLKSKSMQATSIVETEENEPEAVVEDPPHVSEAEDVGAPPEVLEEEVVEEHEEVKTKKHSNLKPRSAAKRTDKTHEATPEHHHVGAKISKVERQTVKGKAAKRTESRTRKEDPIIADDKKGDKGKDKEDAPLEGIEEAEPELPVVHCEDLALQAKNNTHWIDFDQFCICFRTLFIFHKPATYLCNQRYSDLKNIIPATPAPPTKGDKKQAASLPGQAHGPEDKSSHFLFVDNLKPAEVVVAFTVLPRWFDPPPVVTEEKKGSGKGKDKDKDQDKDPAPINSFVSVQENTLSTMSPREPPPPPPMVSPGTVVAEPYSWKSLVTGQPILRLRTTGIRAAVLSLPPGRHVLKFIMTSPLAHHIHMCSTVPVVFGDEETVMPYLVHESCRFKDSAVQLMNAMGRCLSVFTDSQLLAEAKQQMSALLFPFPAHKKISCRPHCQNFGEALFSTLRRALREVATPELALAWRAFRMDVSTPNILGLPLGPRPGTTVQSTAVTAMASETPVASGRGSGKTSSKKQVDNKQSSEPEKTESVWMSKYLEPTVEEHIAAVKIQKNWRGYWVRKVKSISTPGTEGNAKAHEQLMKAWTVLEANLEEHGLFLYRELFKKNVDIMQHYPFFNDEWNRVSYADYRGQFPEQPPTSWFIIFREVFHVKEESLVVPRLYVPIPTCMLRVIDNDTGHQLPTIFQKVAPYHYKPNKRGYTFVAEARTLAQPQPGGAWRMRLIGSFTALPAPRSPEVNSSFCTKEIMDYYLPQPKDILFRYAVKVTSEQLCSLQVCTSKADVYVRLCVLDHEEEVASATGKGHVVIPAFIFHKDVLLAHAEDSPVCAPSQQEVRRTSRAPSRVGSSKGAKLKTTSSAKSHDDKASRDSPTSDPVVSEAVEEKTHKYIVQATVLKNSWTLSEEDRAFVNKLKEEEKNELKVFWVVDYRESIGSENGFPLNEGPGAGGPADRQPSPPKMEKQLSVGPKANKAKGKGGKEKEQASLISPVRTVSFPDKPSWTLRLIVDAAAVEDVEVKKDTERVDEIRAMKKAWEETDPGRAAKAHRSRQKYLTSLLPKEEETTDKLDHSSLSPLPDIPVKIAVAEEEKTSHPDIRPSTADSKRLEPLDFSAYYRGSEERAVMVDDTYRQEVLAERQRRIYQFKMQRQEVEDWRARDRVERNTTKLRQLEDAQALQLKVDEKREVVNVPREAFRQVYLEAERKRQEELAQQEAQLKLEMEAKAEKTKKNAKGKKKK